MVSLRTKLYLVAAIPTALMTATFYISSTVDGSNAIFLFRLGLTFGIAGFVFCMITWDAHRIHRLREDVTFHDMRADMADQRATKAEAQMNELDQRIATLEEDKKCLDMIRKMWTPEDDDRLRKLLRIEES